MKDKFTNLFNRKMERRSFLKWSGAVTAPAVLGGVGLSQLKEKNVLAEDNATVTSAEEVVVSTCNVNNCGGRCVIKAHVKDGNVVRISTDTKGAEGNPALKACVRGRNYKNLLYHPDRLKYPMKRVGKRGEGKFERISWEEAIDTIAKETQRITEKHGPESRYPIYATGMDGSMFSGLMCAAKLFSVTGGYLNYSGSYSSFQTQTGTAATYGAITSGATYNTLKYSKLIILWAHNPAATIFGPQFRTFLTEARKNGTKIIVIDPRHTDTVVAFADQWIAPRPATDSALMDAMAYVMVKENLHDKEFLAKYCQGFTADTLPEGIPANESIEAYLVGEKDGIPKTPEWAEKITGVEAKVITQLARDYATAKPAALIQGLGGQRHANGEQFTRSGIMLAAMTGNVGKKGGWGAGMGAVATPQFVNAFNAMIKNPIKSTISCFTWTDAVERGTEMTAAHGLQGTDKLKSNIKLIYNMCGNVLLNQHSDINRTKKILEDDSKVEFIVTSDLFMTASAQYSDIVLPATSFFERWDVGSPWGLAGSYAILGQKVVEPMHECRNEYEVLQEVAKKLGVEKEYTNSLDRMGWINMSIKLTQEKMDPTFPAFEEFKKKEVHFFPPIEAVGFQKEIEDPANNPFKTPSGKIELFSSLVWAANQHEAVPPIPKYVPAFEGHEDPLAKKYPIQLIGWHSRRRCHSTHDNQPLLEESQPQVMWMNPKDAEKRNIKNGDKVKVFNDRGTILMPVKVTDRIIPGVCGIPQGAWYTPDKDGNDTRGAINVLTNPRPTAWAKANPQHTNLVEITKA